METPSTSNNPNQSGQADSRSDTERYGTLIGGGALILMGLKQRSLRGALLALAGGGLAYQAATAQKSLSDTVSETVSQSLELGKSKQVEKTVTISNKTPAELYSVWRNFENLPMFMKHLKSVQVIDETRSHWVAKAPLDSSVEWDAEIVSDQENQLIAWASVEGADIDNSGFVRFQAAPEGRGTEVKVVLEYTPPGGTIGNTIAKIFGEAPEQQIGEELRNFKMLMEAGEIASTEGQSSGRS
ncbi:cyclase [Phormidium sp. CLA17]|uniref:SRPBCC family protein n=1 Tax=Leptolyngbya sp. Cla-17 TaxID=2803751 RepID=UPI0014920B53|nr:SRPBCC family protein [Leptolyngbya sp. Cla-17]MBM0740948.1 cyclase [Leptolyngbya sp. Cla-17]